jgi:hypothetical protein
MTTVGGKTIWEFMNASLENSSYRTRGEQIVLSAVFVGYTIVGILGEMISWALSRRNSDIFIFHSSADLNVNQRVDVE